MESCVLAKEATIRKPVASLVDKIHRYYLTVRWLLCAWWPYCLPL